MKINSKKTLAAATALCLLTSSPVFAAQGDYLRLGPSGEKSYAMPANKAILIDDVRKKVEDDTFYKELADGKYINPVVERENQMKKLAAILAKQGLMGPGKQEEAKKYLKENIAVVQEALLKATEETPKIERPSASLKVASVSAINAKEVKIVFNKAVKDAILANFKALDKDNNLIFATKLSLNKEKTEVTLTFLDPFADKAAYTLEISGMKDANGNKMEKQTKTFQYEVAAVASVEFVKTTLPKNKDLVDCVKVSDAMGRDVTKDHEIEYESSDKNVVDLGAKKTKNKGSAMVVAKVKVGDKWVKSPQTVINVEEARPATFAGYYLAASPAADTAAYEALKEKEKVDFVNMGDSTLKLGLYYKDQFGEKMTVAKTNEHEMTVTNLNPAVVIVEKDTENTLKVKPMSEGEGFVKIKFGTVEKTIKITVKEASEITSLTAKKEEVSLGTGDGVKIADVELEYKDQYGQVVVAEESKLSVKSADENIATVAKSSATSVKITAKKKGSTTIDLSYKIDETTTLQAKIKVHVVEAGAFHHYEVETATTDLDINGGAPGKRAKETLVRLFQVDEKGNKVSEVTLDGTDAKLVEVDAKGNKPAPGIVTIESNKTVQAAKEGTAYVQVQVGTLGIKTLTFNVIDSKPKATTATFKSVNINYGEVDNSSAVNKALNDSLKTMVNVKDQNDVALADFDSSKLTFKYTITNIDGMVFNGEENNKTLQKLSKPKMPGSHSADIVVTEVTYDAGTENLLSAPVTVKVQAKDTKAPVLNGVPNKPVKQISGGVVTSASADIVKATLKRLTGAVESKDFNTLNTLVSDDMLNTSGTYQIIVEDAAGNVTESAPFIIDKTAPTVKVKADKTEVKDGAKVIFTATFSEEMDQTKIPKIELTTGETLDATEMTMTPGSDGKVWTYEHTMEDSQNNEVKAKITVAQDVAGNAVTGTFVSQADGTGLTADNTAPTYASVSLATDDKTLTITFTEERSSEILNALGSDNALKEAIELTTNGTDYGALAAEDTVQVDGKTIKITFENKLTGTQNKVKIKAGAIKDEVGNLIVATTTDAIDADSN